MTGFIIVHIIYSVIINSISTSLLLYNQVTSESSFYISKGLRENTIANDYRNIDIKGASTVSGRKEKCTNLIK